MPPSDTSTARALPPLPSPSPSPRASWRTVHGHRYMYLRLGPGPRVSIPLSGCATDAGADARAERIARAVAPLAAEGKRVEAKAIAVAIGREVEVTVRAFAERWLSGELARLFPDHVKAIDQGDNRDRLGTYVLPVIGDRPMGLFEREDADLVMARLPPSLAPGTRRHVAQCLHRLAVLAVFPGKILRANPIPRGWLPKVPRPKGSPFLYPKEDGRLLASAEVPLDYRFAYGVLAREGLRASELVGLRPKEGPPVPPMPWTAINLDQGTVTLERTKTGDVRTWRLDPGTHRALVRWRELYPQNETVLPPLRDLARRLRAHLRLAGVDRAELGTRSHARTWLKAHHLRATFVTLALASGKTEAWVQDRTGHRSSAMVNRYRRAARMAAELELGELLPLDEAIPELRSTP